MRVKLSILSIAALSVAVGAGTANAQLSNYYVTDGNSGVGMTHGWNGGANFLNYTWAGNAEISIYTTGSVIRQVHYQAGLAGTEYDLAGTPTGNTYTQGGIDQNYDAGFDGTNVYQVDFTTGAVARFDTSFQNRTFLFNANVLDLGITYDGATNTIWTSSWVGGGLSQYDLNGNLVSSFNPGIQNISALAWDPQDDTLWMSDAGARTHVQYSKTGTLLSSYSTGVYVLGGEMAPIPAPASLTLLAFGGLAATRRRRRA